MLFQAQHRLAGPHASLGVEGSKTCSACSPSGCGRELVQAFLILPAVHRTKSGLSSLLNREWSQQEARFHSNRFMNKSGVKRVFVGLGK